MERLVNHINKQLPYALVLTRDMQLAKDLGKLLSTVMRNIFIDQWRRNHRYVIEELNAGNEKRKENDVWYRLQQQELQRALMELKSSRQQFCFRLRLDGWQNKEIAAITGQDTNRVNQTIMRTKTILKKQLAV